MDQEIRNKLRNVVTQCRRLLEDAIAQELEGKYGIFATKDQVTADPNARMTHLSDEEQAARRDILDHYAHIKARGFKPKDALDQLIRETAFTHLNRLCAYKMMEAREVYVGGQKFREAVSRGVSSNGVKFYLAEHPEEERLFNTGHQDVAYRHFLDWLGGALSDEIGVLFNPNDPANRLYPRQKTLDEVLDLLNGGGIKAEETELREQWPQIWSQDETIGWVYQYFTPKELRDQARKESQAPRNSYELAFRNQFFTPRYVVEFLTDNTLGRIWYEMRKGATKLKDQCRYMVRRPTEIFLKDGEQPPRDVAETQDDLSQEELLKLPVHIPHRPKKDPRELRILDPACGSGHFLLYCFDLLLTIYEEAYADPDLGPALKMDYPTLDAFKRDVPRLILAHNLHGIDIDLRASQIAALALWLRSQRAYKDMGLKKDRPRITRSNFVCAEPMPGEEQMLKEFVGQLEPKVLGQVVEVVFDKMKLAGEAGSLLKIEEEIRDAVAAAKKQYVRETTQATDRKGQPLLFTQAAMDRIAGKPEQPSLFDLSDITDNQFFEQAESRVIETLRTYAEKAHNGQRLQRRLFSEDAVRGFAFVDVCQKRYDVALMNPPFGEPTRSSKSYLADSFPKSKNDILGPFVELSLNRLLHGGLLGAITSRTAFFLSSMETWRREVILGASRILTFADLGEGVLDSAMVKTSAYVLQKGRERNRSSLFLRLLHTEDKATALLATVRPHGDRHQGDVFLLRQEALTAIPGQPLAYWSPRKLRECFLNHKSLEAQNVEIKQGLGTTDDFRFVRCYWEVDARNIGEGQRWRPYAKGGESQFFFGDVHLLVNWEDGGREIYDKTGIPYGGAGAPIRNPSFYFRQGLTYTSYTNKGFRPRVLPKGCIFTTAGMAVFTDHPLELVAFLNSQAVQKILSMITDNRKWEVGYVQKVPLPKLTAASRDKLRTLASRCWDSLCELDSTFETSRFYRGMRLATGDCKDREASASLKVIAAVLKDQCDTIHKRVAECVRQIDDIANDEYGFDETLLGLLQPVLDDAEVCEGTADNGEEDTVGAPATEGSVCSDVVSYAFGCVIGRWDVRKVAASEIGIECPEPFAELPPRSPGMLHTDEGVTTGRSLEGYPIRVNSEGIVPDDADHTDDIIRRVQQAFEFIWRGRADTIESEACEILGVKELRDYFRKPGKGGFWDDHISRYSKSRRKAPIYWLLQSSKKNYALWLYYHRLDKDLLFKALVNYVEPKIRLETSRLESLSAQKAAAGDSGKEAKRIAKDVERQEEFLSELRDFEDKLRRAANLHLEPDLNDGVVLNIAPLWELVPWKEAKKYWDELMEGQYEWSSIGKQLREKGLVKT